MIHSLGGTLITALSRGTVCLVTDMGQLQLLNLYRVLGGENLISTYQLERSRFLVKWLYDQHVVISDSQGASVLSFAQGAARLTICCDKKPYIKLNQRKSEIVEFKLKRFSKPKSETEV